MSERVRDNLTLGALVTFAAVVFVIGITWGLPSRKTDAFLFGDRIPWTGAQILALTPPRTSTAADVDSNPAVRGSVLNDTDAKRAEIVRRYRLFTYQPDEMITLMSLARMHPSAGDFDPRLYQYGGLWIYPVGVLIKLLLHPVADPAYYLDHPEEFAKFYVVARAYSAVWGVVGAWAVYRLIRRCAGRFSAVLATLMYTTMPVVVNMAHEAKPHLPAAALMLLTAGVAQRFINQGRRRDLVAMSLLCGAAAGMILSASVAIIIALTAILIKRPHTRTRPEPAVSRAELGSGEDLRLSPLLGEDKTAGLSARVQGERGIARVKMCVLAISLALATYFVSNPYVLKHLLTDRSILSVNLANSGAMYRFDPIGGAIRSVQLISEGAGLLTVAGAIVGIGSLVVTKYRPKTDRHDEVAHTLPTVGPLVACSLVVAFQFAALAAGKPGEYARFALILDIALALIAAVALGGASIGSKTRNVATVVLVLGTTLPGSIYEYGFWSDSRNITRRDRLAQQLVTLKPSTLALWDEPAPYLMPAMDLWAWNIVLLLRETPLDDAPAQIMLRPVDRLDFNRVNRNYSLRQIAPLMGTDVLPATISWADKPFEVWERPAPRQLSLSAPESQNARDFLQEKQKPTDSNP